MTNQSHLGFAAFHPYGDRPIWPANHGYPTGHAIRSIICTDDEFEAVCRFLAERRAAGAGQQQPDAATTLPSYENIED